MDMKEVTVIKVSKLKEAKAGEPAFEVKIQVTEDDTCGDEPRLRQIKGLFDSNPKYPRPAPEDFL